MKKTSVTQGAWEPVNVDAAARTSAQEIEVGTGEEKELFLASQVSDTNTLPVVFVFWTIFSRFQVNFQCFGQIRFEVICVRVSSVFSMLYSICGKFSEADLQPDEV